MAASEERSTARPVQVIWTTLVPPTVSVGKMSTDDAGSYDVTLEVEAPAGAEGALVVLDFGAGEEPFVQGRVEAVEGRRIRLEVLQARDRDRREFPRVDADLAVRYRVAPDDTGAEALEAWADAGQAPVGASPWSRPGLAMNLSASGLSFDDRPAYGVGAHLLVEVFLPDDETPYRGVARVIRCDPLPAEERDPTGQTSHHVAVDFVHLGGEARQALLELSVEALHLEDEPDDDA